MAFNISSEVLDLVLLKLPTKERVAASAVCSGWSEVAQRVDSTLWATARLGLRHCNAYSGRQERRQRKLAAAMLAWAAHRAPFIRRLRLDMRPLGKGCSGDRIAVASSLLDSLASHGRLRAFWTEEFADPDVLRNRCVTMAAACSHLTQLVLGHVSAELVIEALGHLPNLQELSMGYVRSRMVGRNDDSALLDVVGASTRLRHLSISAHGCSPRFCGGTSALASLSRLEYLHLSNFGFQGMPLAVASLTALRTLRLVCHEPVGGGPEPVPRRCLFVQPPALGLARLPRLAYAQLDWRLQCALPAGALTQLRLDASDHLCGTRRPGAPLAVGYLSCLTALRHLSVTWPGLQAQLPALAATLGSLPTLDHLALSQCELTSLPPIACLSRVTALGLRCNALAGLPPALAAAQAVQILDLSYNVPLMKGLTDADAALLLSLPALRVLWMQPGTRSCSLAALGIRALLTGGHASSDRGAAHMVAGGGATGDAAASGGLSIPAAAGQAGIAAPNPPAPPAGTAAHIAAVGLAIIAASDPPPAPLGAAAQGAAGAAAAAANGGASDGSRRPPKKRKGARGGARRGAPASSHPAAPPKTAEAAAAGTGASCGGAAAKGATTGVATADAASRPESGAAAPSQRPRQLPALVWCIEDAHTYCRQCVDGDGSGSGLSFEDVCESC